MYPAKKINQKAISTRVVVAAALAVASEVEPEAEALIGVAFSNRQTLLKDLVKMIRRKELRFTKCNSSQRIHS